MHAALRHPAFARHADRADPVAVPRVEAGRLHEVLGDAATVGVSVTLGWLTNDQARTGGCHAWIGRAMWPAAATLDRAGLLDNSLFVDARSPAERAWAAELCVKCEAVTAVVADGCGFDLTMTRRLQLAARGRDGRLIVLRPAREVTSSAAGSRWTVTPATATNDPVTGDPPRRPRWDVELVRHKGGHTKTDNGTRTTQAADRPAGLRTAGEMFCHDSHQSTGVAAGDVRQTETHRWTYEWNPQQGRAEPARVPVDLPADLAHGPAATPMAWTG